MVDEPLQRLGRIERRSAAAEVERPDGVSAEVSGAGLQLAVQGAEQRLHPAQIGGAAEVAVGADAFAERDMEIDAGHLIRAACSGRATFRCAV